MSFGASAIFSQATGCETKQMPDGLVIYQIDTEKVHYLNPTAAIIFELCAAKQSLNTIAAYLQTTFSLTTLPLNEVYACVEKLLGEGLIAQA